MSGRSLVGGTFLNLYIIDMPRLDNIMVFYGYKNVNFQTKKVICFLVFFKTQIVGTR